MKVFVLCISPSFAQERPFALGGSLSVLALYHFAAEGSVPLLHSPFSCGGLMSSCSFWLTWYGNQASFGRLEVGFWTSVVAGSDPVWVFDEQYTGTERSALITSVAAKNCNLLPFGLGIGYGVGVCADWLAISTWVGGVSSQEDTRPVDLVFPLELIYVPNRRFQVSIDYMPSFARYVEGRVVFSYSHVVSLGIGGNLNFGSRHPARRG